MGNFNKYSRGQKHFAVIAMLFVVFIIFYYAFFYKTRKYNQMVKRNNMEERHEFLSWDNHVQGIFYRVIVPENYKHTVVFLHGQAFTSEIWHNLGTLDLLSQQGYRVFAVDLPGHGRSSRIQKPQSLKERGEFLEKLLDRLDASPAVLVVPSMSGTFALPFIMKHKDSLKTRLSGFVPVAPVGTDKYSVQSFGELNVEALITYGELDTDLGHISLERLKQIPGSTMNMIKDATHACYVKKPKEFHQTLQEFLHRIFET